MNLLSYILRFFRQIDTSLRANVLLNGIVLNARVSLHGISKIQTRARRDGVARPADKIRGAYVQQRLGGPRY